MLIDLNAIPKDRVYDLCVIGGGPAGIAVARQVAARGKSVIVLEAGAMEVDERSQQNYRGRVIGNAFFDLEYARIRAFGGSTAHWGGQGRPLDPIDFAAKPWVPEATWPIDRAAMDPYLRPAMDFLNFKDTYRTEQLGDGMQKMGFKIVNPPPHLGQLHIEEFKASKAITLVLKANLTGLVTDGQKVQSVEVQNYDRVRATVHARDFVFAMGGIENSRLLLHFNNSNKGQLVKAPQALGRYWMEHPNFTIGEAVVPAGTEKVRVYGMVPNAMRDARVLNCGIMVHPVPTGSRMRTIARQLACVAPALGSWVYEQMDRQLVCAEQVRAMWEQEPRAVNRVALDAKARDQFGIPQTELHWTLSDMDRATVKAHALRYAQHIARSGQGRVKIFDWVLNGGPLPENDEKISWHHMGGTRMSRTAETGVVDADCKVWGQDNLFIAGSSVFPSGGWVNPTLSIVQLALRLGDHLAARPA